MSDETILADLSSGKKKLMNKWEYIFSQWTPITMIVGFLIAGILWFSDAEGRLFTDAEARVKTEEHITRASENNGEQYVTKKEFDQRMAEYFELAKENRNDIKEILKYLRK
jgi:hypothetical protein